MSVKENISRLKYTSLCLFLIATLAITGSLIFNNFLISFTFKPVDQRLSLLKEIPGDYVEILCEEGNNYCEEPKLFETLTLVNNTLDSCFEYDVEGGFIVNGKKEYGLIHNNDTWLVKKKSETSKNFKIFLEVSEKKYGTLKNRLNECIKDSKHYLIYKIIPSFYELIYKIKFENKIILATNETVNPFLYGETSISNLVKRFPINYLFKSLLFLSAFLMILYWRYYNNFFNNVLSSNKNKFFIFGICSAVFLFFHVLFLGMEYENELFQKLRRLIIVLFIFSELCA